MRNDVHDGGSSLRRYHVPAVSRAASVLEVLARSGRPLRLADVARELRIPRTSLFSILATLAEERLIEREGQAYRLGDRLAALAASAGAGSTITRISRPVLARLVARLGASAQVAQLEDGVARYVDALEGTHTLRVATWVGKRNSLERTAIGKALILEAPVRELRKLLPHVDEARVERLAAELKESRARGYTIDDEEGEAGVRCVGAPIRDPSGRIVAALSVSVPKAHLPLGRLSDIARTVRESAGEISTGLGPATALAPSRAQAPAPSRAR